MKAFTEELKNERKESELNVNDRKAEEERFFTMFKRFSELDPTKIK